MLLQALPIAVLLFLFFPRLPGQFWLLPTRENAATGLSDEMSPGDISLLSLSGDAAFRVKFSGPLPPASERYWRGPVLHSFDGRRWRRESGGAVMRQNVLVAGPEYSYRITQEPTQRDWLFALDVPTAWPEDVVRLADLQLVSRRPISTLSSFNLQSRTRYRTTPELSPLAHSLDTALPGTANPRTRTFAKELRQSSRDDVAFVQAVLDKFRREEFFYTLAPPRLGDNPVDEFLFKTRRGFCEHYASAFTALMRAANIPSRVVTGYQGGEFNTLGGYLLIKQSDAHAWSEVWLPDQGWVRVDPTAVVSPLRIERNLDAAIADSETVPGRFFRNNFFFSRARLTWDAANNFWNDRVVEYDELKQRSLFASLGIKDADYRTLGIAIALSLLLFFICLTLYLGWQYRPRKRDPIKVVYDELCRKLARVDLPRHEYEGSSDYLRRVATSQPALAAELVELKDLYASLRYGPHPLNSELSRLKYLVNRLQPHAPAPTRTMEVAA
jgi:transglutaminase-like putative cysteine protease